MAEICDRDCFHCQYEDCIADDLTFEDYRAEKEIDRIAGTEKPGKEAGRRKYYGNYYREHRIEILEKRRELYHAGGWEQQRNYYQEHRERTAARRREYYQVNREKALAYQREYYREHREEIAAKQRQRYRQKKEEELAKSRAHNKAKQEAEK